MVEKSIKKLATLATIAVSSMSLNSMKILADVKNQEEQARKILDEHYKQNNLTIEEAEEIAKKYGTVQVVDEEHTKETQEKNETPAVVKNDLKDYLEVSLDEHGYVKKGVYQSEDQKNRATVSEVSEVKGKTSIKSSQEGEKLPNYDPETGQVSGADKIIAHVQEVRQEQEKAQKSTSKGDQVPVIYDEDGRMIPLNEAQVGKSYYTSADKSTKVIFTQNGKISEDMDLSETFTVPNMGNNKTAGATKENDAAIDEKTKIIQLTQDKNSKAGSVTMGEGRAVDLTNNFELNARVYLGQTPQPYGADGIAFGFNPVGNADVGHTGNAFGLGYLNNAFGFKLDTYYNSQRDVEDPYNLKLARAHEGALPYQGDTIQTSPYGNSVSSGRGQAFGAFVYTDEKGTLYTYSDKVKNMADAKKYSLQESAEPYYIDNPGQGKNAGTTSMDIKNKLSDEEKAQLIEDIQQWQPISIQFNAAEKTMTVLYEGHAWKKNIAEWLDKSGSNVKLIISASTGGSKNLQQVAIENLKYSTSKEVQSWKEMQELTYNTWEETPVSYTQNVNVASVRYQVEFQKKAYVDIPEAPRLFQAPPVLVDVETQTTPPVLVDVETQTTPPTLVDVETQTPPVVEGNVPPVTTQTRVNVPPVSMKTKTEVPPEKGTGIHVVSKSKRTKVVKTKQVIKLNVKKQKVAKGLKKTSTISGLPKTGETVSLLASIMGMGVLGGAVFGFLKRRKHTDIEG